MLPLDTSFAIVKLVHLLAQPLHLLTEVPEVLVALVLELLQLGD